MKKIFFLAFLLSLLFTSCKKNDTTPPTTLNTYLSKEIYPNLGTYTWTYNTQNKLDNIVFLSSDELNNASYTYKVNSWDANGRIIDAFYDYVSTTKPDVRMINTFGADGKLLKTNLYDVASGALVAGSNSFEYTTNQIKVTQYSATGAVFNFVIYTLSSDGKNVVERKGYNAANVLQSSDIYSNFDTKKSCFSLFPVGYSIGIPITNNYQTDLFTNATGISTTFTYTYEYNNDGYVTKRISASGATNTYEYIKK